MSNTARAPLCLLSCETGRPFAEKVAQHLERQLLPSTETWFSCGEGKFEINANIRGTEVYIFQSPLGGTSKQSIYDRFVMLLHAIESAAMADAEYITAVIPYYPGARQDKRKGRVREGISAGLFARMLQTAGADRVLSVEIHNDAIAGMFDPTVTVLENVFLTKHFASFIRENNIAPQVVVAPDLGGMERARRYAEVLSADIAALSKQRDYSKANHILSSTLIGEVDNKNILLVDDIVDTAGSVVSSVNELKSSGAKDITIACAHAVLSGEAVPRLNKLYERSVAEGWNFKVLGTSSIYHDNLPSWYINFEIEALTAQIIEKINSCGSVTGLH